MINCSKVPLCTGHLSFARPYLSSSAPLNLAIRHLPMIYENRWQPRICSIMNNWPRCMHDAALFEKLLAWPIHKFRTQIILTNNSQLCCIMLLGWLPAAMKFVNLSSPPFDLLASLHTLGPIFLEASHKQGHKSHFIFENVNSPLGSELWPTYMSLKSNMKFFPQVYYY